MNCRICEIHNEEKVHVWDMIKNDKKYKAYKCKSCLKEKTKRYLTKLRSTNEGKDYLKEKDRKYWKENKDKIMQYRKTPDVIARNKINRKNYKDKVNLKNAKYRLELHANYVRRLIISRNENITFSMIPNELVDAKRALIKLKRKITQINLRGRSNE